MEALNKLLHDLKNKDVKSLILKELNLADLEFMKKAIDDSYKINYSNVFFDHFDDSNKKLSKWIKDHLSQCKYIFARGERTGERCENLAYPNSIFGSDRYCRMCLKKRAVKMLLEDKNTKELHLDVVQNREPDSFIAETFQNDKYRDIVNGFVFDGNFNFYGVSEDRNTIREPTQIEKEKAIRMGFKF